MRVEGNIVDIDRREIFSGSIEIDRGKIVAINRHRVESSSYIMPGFIDAHVHIESSMLTPQNFGLTAIKQGYVAVVTDPHEIANVMGVDGINFMVENSKLSPIKTFFTIPSSVPATPFDLAGGAVTPIDIENLAATGKFVALSEMMNVPGVLFGDSDVAKKLDVAKQYNLPVDGHAPLLQGDDLTTYIDSGISTDHEAISLDEAREKIEKGMKILIRDGSAARNYEHLKSLIETNPDDVMFCSDDLHPDDLILKGGVRNSVVCAINDGFDLFDVIKIAVINPIRHYQLSVGELRVGDSADFIVVDNLKDFGVERVYLNGENRLESRDIDHTDIELNNFNHDTIEPSSLAKAVEGNTKVIALVPGEIITKSEIYNPKHVTSNLESDIANDIIKIVYINRYNNSEPQVAFCRGFNLKRGAFASSVAHDSHNIIAVGCSDKEITAAINLIIEHKGGLAVVDGEKVDILPLDIGGIMSGCSGEEVAEGYNRIDRGVKEMGCNLDAPFMSLSFLSLVVIPELKIGERGLFSYSKFSWVE